MWHMLAHSYFVYIVTCSWTNHLHIYTKAVYRLKIILNPSVRLYEVHIAKRLVDSETIYPYAIQEMVDWQTKELLAIVY